MKCAETLGLSVCCERIQNAIVLGLVHACVHVKLVTIVHKSYLQYYIKGSFAVAI